MRTQESIKKALSEYKEVMGFLEAYRTHDSDDEENFPYLEIEVNRIISDRLDKGYYSQPPEPETLVLEEADNIYKRVIRMVNGVEDENKQETNKPKEATANEKIEEIRKRACSTYFGICMKNQGKLKLHYTSPVSSPNSEYSGSEISEGDYETETEEEQN